MRGREDAHGNTGIMYEEWRFDRRICGSVGDNEFASASSLKETLKTMSSEIRVDVRIDVINYIRDDVNT